MEKTKTTFSKIALYGIIIIISAFALFPFYSMLCMSTHTRTEIYQGDIFTLGSAFLDNARTVLASDFLLWYWNSVKVAVCTTVISVLVACMCGYGLAKYQFRLNKKLFYLVIATMMVPTQTSLVGYIIEMRTMGLINSHLPLILQTAAWPFGVFWVRQFAISSIPTEVMESARMDGASEVRIFFSIGLPFLKPAIASLSMIAFLASWNAYLLPMIVINKPQLQTLQVGIRTFGDMFARDIAAQITGLVLGILPILLVFIIGGKYFVRGLTDGAVKG